MIVQSKLSLIELLHSSNPDVNRIINTFVTHFNKASGHPGTNCWDVSKEDWQRYEFLGDRVINLIVAQILFTRQECVLDEEEMTKILGSVVSNQSLSALVTRIDPQGFARLIPVSIGEQNTYGEKIIGGAFEAFIGALYCEVGLDDVAYFINTITAESLNHYDPQGNAVGILQEYFQKKEQSLPEYREVMRTGPDHKLSFTYEVIHNGKILGTGSGETARQAKQAAAKRALDTLDRTSQASDR
jgi:ribonuclease-3